MSSTVATGTGRVSITTLPALASPQPDDQLLAVQGETVGLLRVGDLSQGKAPDLSGYATTTALSDAQQELSDQIARAIDALPSPPDVSRFITSNQVSDQIAQAISGIRIPSTDGLAQQSDLKAEAEARQSGYEGLSQNLVSANAAIAALAQAAITSDTGPTGRPLHVQRFTVTAVHGAKIAFPRPFASAGAYIMIPNFFDGQNMIISGASSVEPITPEGFTLCSYWVGLGGSNIAAQNTYTIFAIGELSS